MSQNYPLSKNFLLSTLLISSLFSFTGCGMRFYKSWKIPLENSAKRINSAIKNRKYVVIHQGEKQWHLANPSTVDENEQVHIKGQLEDIGVVQAEMRDKLEKKRSNFAYSSRFGKRNIASHQIHLYFPDTAITENEFSIPLSFLIKIEDYDIAFGATFFSHVMMTIILPSTLISSIFW